MLPRRPVVEMIQANLRREHPDWSRIGSLGTLSPRVATRLARAQCISFKWRLNNFDS
jgi:hypothetical protein